MKWLIISTLFIISILFTGCKKTNEEINNNVPQTIIIDKSSTFDVTVDSPDFSDETKMTTSQIIDLFDSLNWNTDSFITVGISPTNAIQFMNESNDKFLVEITNDTEEPIVFHQKFANKEECKEIITSVLKSEKLDSTFLSTFYKVPIMTKTLQEVMSEE